ncbi:hypothetical protein CBR_g40546 [Chara braunii]|uniref:Integrase catalytic domain-containing protein n=1 Tax=Chara braunii TaxID=69332 RepID=A0A388K226_CHABU|nr:hypothetical protein CBR_g40546 [Chara braunii]|eukprot:GBG64098.1 hypothetical protein CBR_g40546 [Chara braunii]
MQVTPMGFTNVVAKAQRRMLGVAGDMLPAKCEPYIDDNPIKGAQDKDGPEIQPIIRRFVWDNLQDIKEFLLVYNITANSPKSILAVPEVTILGFCCGSYGRKPDPTKTDKISQWSTPPHTTTKVRAFLGVVGFWRIFIKGFTKIAEPIRAMNHEEGILDWTEEREAAVQTLKDILTSEQVTLELDRGTRSRRPDLERHIDFDYKIECIAGLGNRADGLSRVCITPEGVEDTKPIDAFLNYEGGTLVVDKKMVESAYTPGELLIKALEKGSPAVVAKVKEGAVTRTDRKEENDSWGDIVGPQEELMAMAVEGGREAVMSLVESWEQKRQQYLVNQEQRTTRVFEPLRPTRVLGPGHLVHLDLVVMPVSAKGYRYILDARDNLSGFVEAVALNKKIGSILVDWIEDFYLRHPFIRRFIADNGTEFVNQDVLSTCKRLGVPIKLIEPYHPEANAPVERGHQTLKNTIAKLAVDDLGNWPKYLKQAVFAENTTPKRTTGCIPAELWYGREIDFPVEALVPTWNRLDDDPRLTTEPGERQGKVGSTEEHQERTTTGGGNGPSQEFGTKEHLVGTAGKKVQGPLPGHQEAGDEHF